MAYSGPFPSWDSFQNWDPLRSLDALTSMWSAATAASLGGGPAGTYQNLFATLRKQVVGRRLTVKLKSGDMTLTVTALDADLDMRALSVGQLNDVSITATELSWQDWQFDRATVVLHNLHIKPSNPPVLVAAPLDLTVEIPTKALDRLIGHAAPRLLGRVDAGGVAEIRWARRPEMGFVAVDASIDGSTLLVKPQTLAVRNARWRLPARIPGYRIQLPTLPRELAPTSVSFSPETIKLTGRMPQWRVDVPRRRLDDIVDQLNHVGKSLFLR